MLSDNVKAYIEEHRLGPMKRAGTWKEYIVYVPVVEFEHGVALPTGLPSCILEKGDSLKFVTGKEAFTIMGELEE